LASRWSPSHTTRSLRADSHPPLRGLVYFHGRSVVPRPYHVRVLLERPRAQSPCARARCSLARHGVSHHVRGPYPTFIARTGSCARPSPSSCLGHTRSTRSVQVAVSPCWEKDLPDVLSAYLSLRAWPPTPAAREVRVPVSSLTTAAFPACGPGRRSTMSRTATAVRRACRGCSHSLRFRPAGVLATQIAPTATASTVGQP
jgi:hypothetical protein